MTISRLLIPFLFIISLNLNAQKGLGSKYINLVEYDLPNGLHVILNSDPTSPIVNIGVMYHVGGKNERADRTGFAHLFEHLMFHGTKNIPVGEFETIIRSAGGYSNANTTSDRTYYYETLPANQLALGIWLESERMLHPTITQESIKKEIEVVKEERRQRYDNNPYGSVEFDMMAMEFKKHPYRMPLIGFMEHLDAATFDDFIEFSKTYYTPNNACLVISGGIDIEETKRLIALYFSDIPRGKEIVRPRYDEQRAIGEVIEYKKLKGIKSPHIITSYMTAKESNREAQILNFAILLLNNENDGEVKLLPKEEGSCITKLSVTPEFYEDAGMVWTRASYNDSISYDKALASIDAMWDKIAKEGFSDKRIDKLKRAYEKDYIDVFFSHPTICEFAANYHFLMGGAKNFLNLVDNMKSITNEDIKAVVSKYMVKDNRRVIVYNIDK